jgi:hypothetical protein
VILVNLRSYSLHPEMDWNHVTGVMLGNDAVVRRTA